MGFALNHIEVAFDGLFGLKGQPDEYTELDTEALLRSAFKDRVEGYARGVQGGIFAPDEAALLSSWSRRPAATGKSRASSNRSSALSRRCHTGRTGIAGARVRSCRAAGRGSRGRGRRSARCE